MNKKKSILNNKNPREDKFSKFFPIVGISASAGGLEAFEIYTRLQRSRRMPEKLELREKSEKRKVLFCRAKRAWDFFSKSPAMCNLLYQGYGGFSKR